MKQNDNNSFFPGYMVTKSQSRAFLRYESYGPYEHLTC